MCRVIEEMRREEREEGREEGRREAMNTIALRMLEAGKYALGKLLLFQDFLSKK